MDELTKVQELKELVHRVCQTFPGAHVNLKFEVTRFRPMIAASKELCNYEIEYSLYVSDVIRITAPTVELLIARIKTQLLPLGAVPRPQTTMETVMTDMAAWLR